ncbi:SsrA-binding protein SmpB [Puniceicoccus vermicola]|uniref:SsrA-binding protein n=1 Tax=Puniceicoccus vermicola TaxID=388746 RepID=A0A7X1AVM1_9BACT|nr:SsrA-binding protein SmpB [Puniceicoccus vermicola]
MARSKKNTEPVEIRNRRAFHDYHIHDKFEAGLVLQGTEVKSVRLGKAQIQEAFVRFDKGEPFLYHAYIDEYKFGNENNHAPRRPRKLLLHQKEIRKLHDAIQMGGKTVVPLKLYFLRGNLKAQIAIASGKKLHDKRETLKKKEADREANRAVRDFQRYG